MTRPESNAAPYLSERDRMLQRFIGKPWRALATGPDAYDCWSLACTAARELFGLSWPVACYAPQDCRDASRVASGYLTRPRWQERAEASAGALLALCSYDGSVRHVALCISASRCLHIAGATRSCVLPIAKLCAVYPRARFYVWVP